MARRFEGGRLVLATHNAGKARELQALLAPLGVEVVAAGALGLPEPEETGLTYIDNARLKAHAAAEASGLPALADDSGIDVHGLDGAPGIYSARWAGPGKDFAVAIERVMRELAERFGSFEQADKGATFVCALCLAWPDGEDATFEGRIAGRIVPPRGTNGFGYDPIFIADGQDRTFGEMAPEEKEPLTHRAKAFAQLLDACFSAGPAREAVPPPR